MAVPLFSLGERHLLTVLDYHDFMKITGTLDSLCDSAICCSVDVKTDTYLSLSVNYSQGDFPGICRLGFLNMR